MECCVVIVFLLVERKFLKYYYKICYDVWLLNVGWLRKKYVQNISVAEMKILRRMRGDTNKDKLRNEFTRMKLKVTQTEKGLNSTQLSHKV